MENAKGLIAEALDKISKLEKFVATNEAICKEVADPQKRSIILSGMETGTEATLEKIDGIKKSLDKIDAKIYDKYVQPDVARVCTYVADILNHYGPKGQERSPEELKKRWEDHKPVGPLSPGGA